MRSLSELPDHIILRIVSLAGLTNKEAIQISVLSKELFWAVQNRAALIFNPATDTFYREELEYVHSTLLRYYDDHIPLDSFTFKMGGHHRSMDMQNQCFTLAAKKRITDLDLRGLSDFPEPFFKAESLVNFSLQGSSFKPWKAIAWPNLRRLRLVDVNMKLDDFEDIIMGSPLIENLEIVSCFHCNVKCFKISNLGNLKILNVDLRYFENFEVKDVLKLESITCHRSQVIGLCRQFNERCHNLRTLSLDSARSGVKFFIDSGHFPRLEDLSITNSSALQIIVISSLSLKKIRLENNFQLEEARFDVPNIVLFEYSSDSSPSMSSYSRSYSILKLSFSGNPSGWISRIKLSYFHESVETGWFLKLNEFLRELNMSEISITVNFHAKPLEYGPKIDARQNVLGVTPRVKEFHIDSSRGFSLLTASAVVEAISWVCRPQTVTFPPRYPSCYLDKLERLLCEKRILQSVDGKTDVTITLREGCLDEVIMNDQEAFARFRELLVQIRAREKKRRSSNWFRFKFFSHPFTFS